jgi:glycosyltransferase involved in cell wall biosynthesis
VRWFAQDMLPLLRQRHPDLRFYVVGRSPTPQVQALASEAVIVTGTVPDVRPYLQHATAVVAPLRVARGIQNKILEAMAMEQAVVTVPSCADAIGATAEQGLLTAEQAQPCVDAVLSLLADRPAAQAMGQQARRYVLDHYSWDAHLRGIDACLPAQAPGAEELVHG